MLKSQNKVEKFLFLNVMGGSAVFCRFHPFHQIFLFRKEMIVHVVYSKHCYVVTAQPCLQQHQLANNAMHTFPSHTDDYKEHRSEILRSFKHIGSLLFYIYMLPSLLLDKSFLFICRALIFFFRGLLIPMFALQF